MELKEMIYRRLSDSESLQKNLAIYGNSPAVFYQQAPTSDDPNWDGTQYPRIDYTVDMQENPARNASGVLVLNVWCDSEFGASPEEIEAILRGLIHAAFAQTDDYPFCFAWVRSDTFEAKTENEQTARTIGVTVVFDVMACPCQYTMFPDPIKAMNQWTKKLLPNAIVLGEDDIIGWILPSRDEPVIYWRLAALGQQQKHLTHTWISLTIEGHVYARTASDRLYNLVKINTASALAGHIPMEDSSPLFLDGYVCRPHLNYISQGQIQTGGRFGILQPAENLSHRSTGQKLNRVNIPREILDFSTVEAKINETDSKPYIFPYAPSSACSQSGTLPDTNTVGATANDSASPSAETEAFSFGYQLPGDKNYIDT